MGAGSVAIDTGGSGSGIIAGSPTGSKNLFIESTSDIIDLTQSYHSDSSVLRGLAVAWAKSKWDRKQKL